MPLTGKPCGTVHDKRRQGIQCPPTVLFELLDLQPLLKHSAELRPGGDLKLGEHSVLV